MNTKTAKNGATIAPKTIEKNGLPPIDETIARINTDTPETWQSLLIDESLIDISTRNYREKINQEEIVGLAQEMRAIGFIIEAVTVRVIIEGRYELVVGERRLSAARMAGIKYIPSTVRVLSDEEVDEIQWAENHQRKDPHPMLEARRMSAMYHARKRGVKELAARAGKSEGYVYSRIRLVNLTPEFQNLYLADILDTAQALGIAGLAKDSQDNLYKEYGKSWEKDKRMTHYNFDAVLAKYKCALKNAPFDPQKENLLPDVPACMSCPFNSANKLNQLLFPDGSDGHCTDMKCFDRKSQVGLLLKIGEAIASKKVAALLFDPGGLAAIKEGLEKIPGASTLKTYDKDKVTEIDEPAKPHNYTSKLSTDAQKKAAAAAEEAYRGELSIFRDRVKEGKIMLALYIHDFTAEEIFFIPGIQPKTKSAINPDKMSKAQVKVAIKANIATPNMIDQALGRMKELEENNQKRDKEIVANNIYEAFHKATDAAWDKANAVLNATDMNVMLFLLLDQMGGSVSHIVSKFLGANAAKMKDQPLLARIAKLKDKDKAIIVREAFLCHRECKNPKDESYPILRAIAESSGVDVKKIEQVQAAEAAKRQKARAAEEQQLKSTRVYLKKATTK